MKILFAPAKSFREAIPHHHDINTHKSTLQLVKTISKWSKTNLSKKFKLSDDLTEEVYGFYKNFVKNPSYVAIDYYYGESFKALNTDTLDEGSRQFMHDHVYIIDALYGVIRPLDLIKPYRLDFTISGLDLNTQWVSLFEEKFKGEIEPILSLASDEFTSKITPIAPVYEVHFIDCKAGKCKAISVFNKQQRGALLRHIVLNKIQSIADLPMVFNGYQLRIEGFQLTYQKSID